MNRIKLLFTSSLLLLLCITVQAQFGTRLGNAIENAAKNAAVRKAEEKTDEAVSKTIDKVTDPDSYKEEGKDNSNNEALKEGNNNQSSNEGDENVTSGTKSNTSVPQLESYTQYDFVPGDQIIFYEDFSQDAVGDFPDLWTTDGSGEVRTINLAPGKWYHPTVKDKTFAYLKTIAFPANFIVEFDYISSSEADAGYRGYEFTLYNEENKELNNGLFPGGEGLRFYLGRSEWYARGYKSGFNDDVQGSSNKKTILLDNSINHVIIWVQNRRLRAYHLGEKVLDLPTLLHPNTTFNRLRFFGWGWGDTPYISNIKVTTAAPDVRSKLLTEGKIISYGINFDSGKDVVKPESYGAAKAIADVLKENPDVRVRILGHTDTDGNADANLDLSKRRAAAVKAYLTKEFGIDASRMDTDGKGQTEPLAPNNTVEGKAKNRRVEFVKI